MGAKLKKQYIDDSKREAIIAKVEKDRQNLNDCIKQLSDDLAIDITTVDELAACGDEWVKEYIHEHEEAYYKTLSPFVVKTIRQECHEEFAQAYEEARPICEEIRRILAQNRFTLKRDSKGRFWFDEKEVKAYAVEQATRCYSEEEIEMCSRIGDIVELINDFELWAESHGFDHFFTKEQSVLWNGGTSVKGVTSLLTKKIEKNGFPVSAGRLDFSPTIFRNLIDCGFVQRR